MDNQGSLSSYTIDPRGDLWLCVGEDLNLVDDSACQFRVCSRTLARSSKFFEALLFHGWQESQPPQGSTKDWAVKLPEDNPSTTRHLLEAMHGNFKSFGYIDMTVQAGSDVDRIFELVKLADKYNCLAALGPWSASWLAACDAFLHKADARQYFGAHADHRKNVFPRIACIAFLLGGSDVFQRVMTELVGIHSIKLSWYSGYPLLVNYEPYIPNLTDTVKKEQATLHSSIISAVHAVVDSLKAGNPDFGTRHPIRHHCSSPAEKAACAAHNLKCLTDALGRAGLWLLPSTASQGSLTPLDLRDKLVNVQTELQTAAGERVLCTAVPSVRASNGSTCGWLSRAGFFLDETYKYVLTADDEKYLVGQAALVSTSCPFRV